MAQALQVEAVHIGSRRLPGTLEIPPHPTGIVVFAHGSGSSRSSPRNRFVAGTLHARGLATMLFDLLDEDEATDRRNVFDIALLGGRVGEALQALDDSAVAGTLPVGLFGASTGAAAALVAAAQHPTRVAAVVSRGGRPDLAAAALPRVQAPTLLIVGGEYHEVLALNRWALSRMGCEKRLEVVPGATHLFDEPGTLEAVARLAADWFATHQVAVRTP